MISMDEVNAGLGGEKVPDAPTMVTYKRADGELICGEYAFVTELEWFDMDDEQTELTEEGWVRVSVAKVWAPARG